MSPEYKFSEGQNLYALKFYFFIDFYHGKITKYSSIQISCFIQYHSLQDLSTFAHPYEREKCFGQYHVLN